MHSEIIKVGKRGTVVIPAALRTEYGVAEGTQLVVEARQEGLLLRPVVALPIEIYTPERKAEFLLNNAVTPEDYREAVQRVREMGLEPDTIPHSKPEA